MNYPFNQKCTIKNCIKRDTDHLYDSTTCCDLLEDQEDLDLIEFSQGEAKYEDQRKMFADIVDESQFLNETIEEPKKDNLGSNQKIKKFFEDWGSLEKQIILQENPLQLFLYIDQNPDFVSYRSTFSKARLLIGGIPQSTLAILLQSFIRDSNVQSFVNFNSVALGIKWMYEIKTQQTLQEMKELAQFMVERMTDSVTSIEDDILTIRDVVESLRESTNIIAASTKKLEAEGKILDIKRISQFRPMSP